MNNKFMNDISHLYVIPLRPFLNLTFFGYHNIYQLIYQTCRPVESIGEDHYLYLKEIMAQ